MKTDAEILALLPMLDSREGAHLDRELIAIYRRAFRDGAEAAKQLEPRNIATPPPVDACRPDGLIYELPPVVLSGYQLKEALEFLAPDDTDEQLEQEVCIALRDKGLDMDGHEAPRGTYCWLDEYPEEGSILLLGTNQGAT
jgi:hypothetical protein